MKLLLKSQIKLLQKQFRFGSSMDQLCVVKLFCPRCDWDWYLMNQDPEQPDYCWAIVKGCAVEMGSISLSELPSIITKFLKIERDIHFKPTPASVIWEQLMKEETWLG